MASLGAPTARKESTADLLVFLSLVFFPNMPATGYFVESSSDCTTPSPSQREGRQRVVTPSTQTQSLLSNFEDSDLEPGTIIKYKEQTTSFSETRRLRKLVS